MGKEDLGLDLSFLENADNGADAPQFDVNDTAGIDVNTEAEETTQAETQQEDTLSLIEIEEVAEYGVEETEEGTATAEDEDEDTEEVDEAPESDKETPSSQIASLTSTLYQEGALSHLDEEDLAEIKSIDDLTEHLMESLKDNEYADLTPEQRDYLEALRNGVPEQEYKEAIHNQAIYEKITEDSLEAEDDQTMSGRLELIKRRYLAKGFDNNEVQSMLKRSVAANSTLEDSKLALRDLKSAEVAKLTKMKEDAASAKSQREADEKVRLEDLKKSINDTKEVIPGVKVNSRTKAKIYDTMTKPVGYTEEGAPLNEVMKAMEDPDYSMKLAALHVMTNGFTKFDKIVNSAKTKAVKDISNTIDENDAKLRTTKSRPKDQKDKGTAGDIFGALDSLK